MHFENQVQQVIALGEEGEFCVLPNHQNLIFNLKPGIVKLKLSDERLETYYLHGGIAMIDSNEMLIITEFVYNMARYSKDEILNKITDLKTNHQENILTQKQISIYDNLLAII